MAQELEKVNMPPKLRKIGFFLQKWLYFSKIRLWEENILHLRRKLRTFQENQKKQYHTENKG